MAGLGMPACGMTLSAVADDGAVGSDAGVESTEGINSTQHRRKVKRQQLYAQSRAVYAYIGSVTHVAMWDSIGAMRNVDSGGKAKAVGRALKS